jgi:hypothetical protein
MEARLPAHLEVSAIRRIAESQGGFATVLAKGERDAGTIAVVISCPDSPAWLVERLPQGDGNRVFLRTASQDPNNLAEFFEMIRRRSARDPDLWVIEAEIANPERFVAALPR